mmetsp:Transcript_18104/g.31618  ORF Transcript_18104/g.31618 Transcript_18104/m.31618 type:complete len:317 (-) Transcript_18104:24-974(-)
MGKKRSLNPADQERREQKKKDLKKAKQQKEQSQQKLLKTKSPEELQRDIRRIEREAIETGGKLSLTQKKRIENLKQLKDEAIEKEKEEELKRLTKHKKRLARKGLKPEDSPFFNPITNPYGLPPKKVESSSSGAGHVAGAGPRKPPRPPGMPPPPRPFIPPAPRQAPPPGADVVPHPRPDLIQKETFERERKQFEYEQRAAYRQQMRIASGEADADTSAPTVSTAPAQPVITAATTRLVPTALRVKRKAAQMSKNEAGPVPITAQELDAAHAAKHANTQTTSDDTPPADKSMVDEAFSQFMADMTQLGAVDAADNE